MIEDVPEPAGEVMVWSAVIVPATVFGVIVTDFEAVALQPKVLDTVTVGVLVVLIVLVAVFRELPLDHL
jgi:hypothetical protein